MEIISETSVTNSLITIYNILKSKDTTSVNLWRNLREIFVAFDILNSSFAKSLSMREYCYAIKGRKLDSNYIESNQFEKKILYFHDKLLPFGELFFYFKIESETFTKPLPHKHPKDIYEKELLIIKDSILKIDIYLKTLEPVYNEAISWISNFSKSEFDHKSNNEKFFHLINAFHEPSRQIMFYSSIAIKTITQILATLIKDLPQLRIQESSLVVPVDINGEEKDLSRRHRHYESFLVNICLKDVMLEDSQKIITPTYLSKFILPYLQVIFVIQDLIDDLKEKKLGEPQIIKISKNSPVKITMRDTIDAVQLIEEKFIPWKREHAKKLSKLKEKESEISIIKSKAEILELKARAEKDKAEKTKILRDAILIQEKAEEQKLKNDKLKIELHREKMKLLIEIVAYIKPYASEEEKIEIVTKILPSIDKIISSPLNLEILKN